MPFNGLGAAEAERLALLLEELGEAQQVIGKILRHGYDSTDPTKEDSPTNRAMLERELGDIRYAEGLMIRAGDVDERDLETYVEMKAEKAPRYLHHQRRHLLDKAALPPAPRETP